MSEMSDPVFQKERRFEKYFLREQERNNNALRYKWCRFLVGRNLGASTIASILAAKTMALNLAECRGEELKSACV